MGWRSPREWSAATWLHWILRVGVLCMFVGHGAFGIIGKAGWLRYYHVFGISDSLAWDTMPIIGAIDIALGIITLIRPMRAVLVYAVFWTTMTALLRPLAGQGLWQEVFERGGNFGLPLALLVLVGLGNRSVRSWFEFARPRELTVDLAKALSWTLRICVALLLIGHGGFGLTHLHDADWNTYFGVLGIGADTAASAHLFVLVGLFEVGLGMAVLLRPVPPVILVVLIWKVGTELLRPVAGEPIWEFIERTGDYALPVALLVIQSWLAHQEDAEEQIVGPAPVPDRWRLAQPAPALVSANVNGHSVTNGRVATPNRAAADADADAELVRAADALVARFTAQREKPAHRLPVGLRQP